MRISAFAVLLALTPFGATAEIGSLAAVNRDVQGTRPAQPPRLLKLNERLIQNERIQTSAESGGQVLFIDQTTLTLTPNSDIILDRYVYDPEKDSGSISVTMLKGAMRMVGGRITKSNAATIKTPSATIGIRGGIGNITVRDDGSTVYMHIAGFQATIDTRNGKPPMTISREGGTAAVSAPPGGAEGFVGAALQAAGVDAGGASGQSGAGITGGGTSGAPAPATGGERGTSGDQPAGDDGSQTGDSSDDTSAETSTETAAGGAQADSEPQVSQASEGGEATYLGVATPEMVRDALSVTAGSGDGGSAAASAPGAAASGTRQLELQVSGKPGARTDPPISTSGERQAVSFNEAPVEFGDPPQDEFADDNQAESVADELTQIFDAITFRGVWTPVAALNDGGIVGGGDQPFRMNYSLTGQEGFVTVGLPDTGDIAGTNLTTFDGLQIRGDRFLVIGDDALQLAPDPDRLTFLGADPDGTAIEISPDDVASGSIFIDYGASGLANLSFVDGAITPITGQREIELTVTDRINAVRDLPVR